MSQKKLLAILGSPHKNGHTATMLDYATQTAKASGYEVTTLNLYDANLHYCTGCRACTKTRTCVQKDDLSDIISSLKECDTIILAAPVYWANVPAPVKNLFDRLLGVAMEETSTFPKPRLSGKHYMLLTSCNTPAPFSFIFGQSRGAIHSMDEFFKTAGMKCIGKYVWSNALSKKGLPNSFYRRIQKTWIRKSGGSL